MMLFTLVISLVFALAFIDLLTMLSINKDFKSGRYFMPKLYIYYFISEIYNFVNIIDCRNLVCVLGNNSIKLNDNEKYMTGINRIIVKESLFQHMILNYDNYRLNNVIINNAKHAVVEIFINIRDKINSSYADDVVYETISLNVGNDLYGTHYIDIDDLTEYLITMKDHISVNDKFVVFAKYNKSFYSLAFDIMDIDTKFLITNVKEKTYVYSKYDQTVVASLIMKLKAKFVRKQILSRIQKCSQVVLF